MDKRRKDNSGLARPFKECLCSIKKINTIEINFKQTLTYAIG